MRLLLTVCLESLSLCLLSNTPSPCCYGEVLCGSRGWNSGAEWRDAGRAENLPTLSASWIFVTSLLIFLFEVHTIFELAFGFAFCHLTFFVNLCMTWTLSHSVCWAPAFNANKCHLYLIVWAKGPKGLIWISKLRNICFHFNNPSSFQQQINGLPSNLRQRSHRLIMELWWMKTSRSDTSKIFFVT